MKEYKLAKSSLIFILITVPLIIIAFGYRIFNAVFNRYNENKMWNADYFIIPLSIVAIGVLIYVYVYAVKGKFVIDHNSVFTAGSLSDRELLFKEIKGYRVDDKFIYIEPNVEGKKKIRISKYFGNTGEIVSWLSNNFPNLDTLETQNEKDEILQSDVFGETTDQRKNQLKQARRIATVLNWTGGLVGAWTLYWRNPYYELALLASVIVPVICIIALKYYKGLIKFQERERGNYPTIIWGIFISSICLFLRASFDYNIFDYSNMWKLLILIAVIFMLLLFSGNNSLSLKRSETYGILFAALLSAFSYSYGSLIGLNCYYDKSEPEIYNATILNKRISTGKSTSYYLKLTPWGSRKEIKEVTVSRALYNNLETGNQVNIYLKKGKFKIPWFTIIK